MGHLSAWGNTLLQLDGSHICGKLGVVPSWSLADCIYTFVLIPTCRKEGEKILVLPCIEIHALTSRVVHCASPAPRVTTSTQAQTQLSA